MSNCCICMVSKPREEMWTGNGLPYCGECWYKYCGESQTVSNPPSKGSIDLSQWVSDGAAHKSAIVSDGGSTDYYKLPEHADELRHLISHKAMSKSRGDIFKACYRLGEKAGNDVMYDLRKMQFFIQDLMEMHKRGEHI